MKRFEFRLEKVRQWRDAIARVEELKLGQLRGELAALDGQRLQLQVERTGAETAIFSGSAANAEDLHHLDSFRQFVESRRAALERLRAQCEARIAAQQRSVVEARRAFELLDGLRRNARAEWQTELNREQEQLASELFLAKRKARPS